MQPKRHDRNEKTKESSDDRDQRFKELVHDSQILASILGGVLPDFADMTVKDILPYLDVSDKGSKVQGKETELFSSVNGPVFMDSVFDVRIPGKGNTSVIVAIEGQGPKMASGDLYNRQEYYSARLISNQAREFAEKKALYHNLRKTVIIWIMINPRVGDRNTIVRDYRVRSIVSGPRKTYPSPLDKSIIYEVNVGKYEPGTERSLLDMLSILFCREMDNDEKHDILDQKYQIDLSSSVIEEADLVGALAEEFEMYGDERYDEGYVTGKAEMAKADLDEYVGHYAQVIADKVRSGAGTLDEILHEPWILPKYREEVRLRAERLLGE